MSLLSYKKVFIKKKKFNVSVCTTRLCLKPQAIDLEFIQWLGENGIPFVICFTKQDKLSKKASIENLKNYEKELLKNWEELPQIF